MSFFNYNTPAFAITLPECPIHCHLHPPLSLPPVPFASPASLIRCPKLTHLWTSHTSCSVHASTRGVSLTPLGSASAPLSTGVCLPVQLMVGCHAALVS